MVWALPCSGGLEIDQIAKQAEAQEASSQLGLDCQSVWTEVETQYPGWLSSLQQTARPSAGIVLEAPPYCD